MVGDGINDAGAMALAHVSLAPGTAADVSQLAADMVLMGGSLLPLVEALDVARKAKQLVLQNFVLAAIYNLTAIPASGFRSGHAADRRRNHGGIVPRCHAKCLQAGEAGMNGVAFIIMAALIIGLGALGNSALGVE